MLLITLKIPTSGDHTSGGPHVQVFYLNALHDNVYLKMTANGLFNTSWLFFVKMSN